LSVDTPQFKTFTSLLSVFSIIMGNSDSLKQAASFLGAMGVGLGALGAHALQETLVKRGTVESWRTAVLYQLFHATAVLGVAALCESADEDKYPRLQRAGQLLTVGSTLFSGSIYMLCFGIGPKKLFGPTTPVGGLIMLSGWIMLGLA
jgi:uncharacterized membrane protein YgdD (TMEM256/DUF423 family)